ncbi:hypothetical protein PMAYCL1PPCAC_01936, partial [Pristionchus mayeri]
DQEKESRRAKSFLFPTMKFLLLFALLARAHSNLISGRCSSDSCENNADCVQFEPNRFYCQCIDAHHFGLRCELKKCLEGESSPLCESTERCIGPNCPSSDDVCERDRPCLNGGICSNTGVSFSCSCPSGFTGAQCELRQSCSISLHSADRCLNSGYCSPEGDCICPTGWSGARCEVDINECQERNPCENFGTCVNRRGSYMCVCLDGYEGARCERDTDNCVGHQCSPGSICVDGVDSYSCQCQEGKGGVYCNETLACRPDTCVNGYCIDSKCKCDSGWTGDRCDEDIDECLLSPCAEGSTCLNKNGSFECICPEGRRGLRCEADTCSSHRECLNGGRCVGGECRCKRGFAGPSCQLRYSDPCSTASCTENRVCSRNSSEILGYSCDCPRGFGGRLCTIPTNCSSADKTDSTRCSLSGCARLAGNGVCNPECNHFACGFDGGDCSAGTVPFSRCPDASFCARGFKDGKCDQKCNNENCLFDGFDCAGPEPEERRSGTMTEITLIVLVKPVTFLRKVDDFLKSLAERLRTSVIVKKTEGEMDVFEWNNKEGEGRRVGFGSRTDARFEYSRRTKRSVHEGEILYGTLVVIQVDLSECSRECFSDANAVALFIGATEAKEPLNPTMPIHNALIVKTERSEPTEKSSHIVAVICLVALFLSLVIVALKSTKRRHIIEAPVWIPPCKEAARESANNYYSSGILGMNGYQGFQSFGEPSSKMPAPVFKRPPAPIEMPASSPLEMAAAGEERITPQMRQFVSQLGRYERTALHWLGSNTVKSSSDLESDCILLISFGVDVNAQDMEGNTALHYACANGNVCLVRRLLAGGADPSIDNELDLTPLHVAAQHADDVCMKMLIDHPFYKDPTKFDVVDLEDRTPLMLYAANSCLSIKGAELLLKAKADINYAGDKKRSHFYKGRTALHHAAQSNRDNGSMIKFLVDNNSNKDAQDFEEATPLWLAVNANNLVAVDELLKAGASLDFADQKERTPEGLAYEKGYQQMSKRLEVARLRQPIIGLSSYSTFPTRSTTIQPPRIMKKPIIKKFKSPTPSSEGTPSPPGLKASTSSGPSCLDSPHSDQGRLSANSSSSIGSPAYTPSYTQPSLHPMQQPQLQQLQPSPMRPSPPYDNHDPHSFYPSLSLPPLSLNQPPASAYSNESYVHHPQYAQYNPPACAYQNQQ